MSQLQDVIVIGCGASGVAALRKLHDAGLRVLGLEAAERIGGRVWSVPFGAGNIDVGAAWCHGEQDNLVFELANPLGLLGRPEPDNMVFVYGGKELKEAGPIKAALEEALGNADKNNATSISECLRDAIKTNVLSKDSAAVTAVLEWFERNSHVGGQTDSSTGKSLKGLQEFWNCEGEFMLNWKGRGYTTILDVLLKRYPDPKEAVAIPILLNKEVETIKWSSMESQSDKPLVAIQCSDGSSYSARSVVVTVSLGVLKERHQKLFSPPLPAEKVNSINNLQMCVLDKIYIEFEKPWWPVDPCNIVILWREEDKAQFSREDQWITEVYGLQTIDYQPNVLLAWIYGKGAERMENVSLENVRAGVLKLFEKMLPQYQVAPVKNIIRTQWASNPLARGTYSYRCVATEMTGAGAAQLSEPLRRGDQPLVCFAGEATSHHRHSAVHGAVEAGFREADRLIQYFKSSAV